MFLFPTGVSKAEYIHCAFLKLNPYCCLHAEAHSTKHTWGLIFYLNDGMLTFAFGVSEAFDGARLICARFRAT